MALEFINEKGERISLDDNEVISLINMTRYFVSITETYYPDVYEDIMQYFDELASGDPVFKTDRDLFTSIIFPQDFDQDDTGQAAAAGNLVRSNREKEETYDSEEQQQFGKPR